MASLTNKYRLKKPSEDDFYDVADFNHNTDLIEEQLLKNETAIEKIKNTKELSVASSAWSAYGEVFTASVSVNGLKETDEVNMYFNNKSSSRADIKTDIKNYSYIYKADTANGFLHFYAYKKPTKTVNIIIRGA